MSTTEAYSVPEEAANVLNAGIIHNPLLVGNIPANAAALAQNIKFSGSSKPNIPVNWRFAESISALKGLEALWLNALLELRYKASPVEIEINTYGSVPAVLAVDDMAENFTATMHLSSSCLHYWWIS